MAAMNLRQDTRRRAEAGYSLLMISGHRTAGFHDEADSIAIDSAGGYMYVVGKYGASSTTNFWAIEKRRL
jgi:hypothetical protein